MPVEPQPASSILVFTVPGSSAFTCAGSAEGASSGTAACACCHHSKTGGGLDVLDVTGRQSMDRQPLCTAYAGRPGEQLGCCWQRKVPALRQKREEGEGGLTVYGRSAIRSAISKVNIMLQSLLRE